MRKQNILRQDIGPNGGDNNGDNAFCRVWYYVLDKINLNIIIGFNLPIEDGAKPPQRNLYKTLQKS